MIAVKNMIARSMRAGVISWFLIIAYTGLSVYGYDDPPLSNCALASPLPNPDTSSDSQLCITLSPCPEMSKICRYFKVIDKFKNLVDQYCDCAVLPTNS